MTAYRGYLTVHGDDGKRLGVKGLQPIADNLNAHVREADEQGWRIRYNAFTVMTHLGKPAIRLEVDEAWQVRLAYRIARAWLRASGLKHDINLNANTRKAV